MSKEKFDAARELIKEKKDDEARALLETIDHPKARELIAKLDARIPQKPKSKPRQRTSFSPIFDAVRWVWQRKHLRWVQIGIVVAGFLSCIMCSLIGQALNIIPTAQESNATRTAEAQGTQVAQAATDAIQRSTDTALTQIAQLTANANATNFALTPPTPTPTITPSATITDTPTPSNTPVPSATPVTTLRFEIEGVEFFDNANGQLPSENLYVVIKGRLINESNQELCAKARDARLLLDGRLYAPQSGVMDALKPILKRDFLGAYSGQCVPGGESVLTYVAFDVTLGGREGKFLFNEQPQTVALEVPADHIAQITATAAVVVREATANAANQATQIALALTPQPTATITDTPIPQPTDAPPETRYTQREANVRTCAKSSDSECPIIIKLSPNTPVMVIGSVQGERYQGGSDIWHKVIYNGQEAYIHSSLIALTPPVATNVPAQVVQPPVSQPQQTWSCTVDYDCGDFQTYADVMSYWNTCPGDPSNLDGDNDGTPCDPTNWR